MPALRTLDIRSIKRCDLSALSTMEKLERLGVIDPVECSVPTRLKLSPALQLLWLSIDIEGATGAVIQALADAIEWNRLSSLQSLNMRVGGLEALPPIEVDLALLREIPQLRELSLEFGIRPRQGTSSPLAPPFEGLPAQLEYLSLDAEDPESLRKALQQRVRGHVNVVQRVDRSERPAPWSIKEVDDGYVAYGSLADLADGEFDTEYDAYRAAKRKIREANPALLKRLDFDPESSGTGINSRTREDLEAALRIFGSSPS